MAHIDGSVVDGVRLFWIFGFLEGDLPGVVGLLSCVVFEQVDVTGGVAVGACLVGDSPAAVSDVPCAVLIVSG